MSKFLLNLLLQISKALVNSKIHFNSEISFFMIFSPADPAARLASGPASPLDVPSPQVKIIPAGPSSPRVGRVFAGNTFSFSVHVFSSWPPLPRLSINRASSIKFNHVLSSPQLLLTERRRLPVLHHRRSASIGPPELRCGPSRVPRASLSILHPRR
jgi:hypothetical protein